MVTSHMVIVHCLSYDSILLWTKTYKNFVSVQNKQLNSQENSQERQVKTLNLVLKRHWLSQSETSNKEK